MNGNGHFEREKLRSKEPRREGVGGEGGTLTVHRVVVVSRRLAWASALVSLDRMSALLLPFPPFHLNERTRIVDQVECGRYKQRHGRPPEKNMFWRLPVRDARGVGR